MYAIKFAVTGAKLRSTSGICAQAKTEASERMFTNAKFKKIPNDDDGWMRLVTNEIPVMIADELMNACLKHGTDRTGAERVMWRCAA
jgi:hypothetical protein